MADLACPSCGTDVAISLDVTCVTVCPSCLKVLERSDVGLVDRGVLAPLKETRSRLRVGLRGRYEYKFFTVCGRVQVTESGGNLWDEWYAAFDGGQWGWLAEDRGRIWLSMAVEHPGYVPKFSQVRAGDVLTFDGRSYTVSEVDTGQVVAAEGEIPFHFTPDERLPFADLSGADGGFGTIDYTFDPPRVYLGRELPVDAFKLERDIDLHVEGEPPTKPAPPESICPGCQKKVELRTPGETVRAVCPHCDMLCDVDGRALKAIRKVVIQSNAGPRMWLPLGATGTLRGEKLTVVAWRLRSVFKEGVRYPWQEALLYGDKGYRYLDCADGHFTLGRSIAAGEVSMDNAIVRYQGKKFERFSIGDAVTEAIVGEWPWRVDPFERNPVAEFVAPPLLLARELGEGEIDWTLTEHVDADEVAAAFPTGRVPPPNGVGAAQPYKHSHIFRIWRWAVLALVVGFTFKCSTASDAVVLDQIVSLDALPPNGTGGYTLTNRLAQKPTETFPPAEAGQPLVVTTDAFDLAGGKNVLIEARAGVDNSWVFAAGQMLNEETGDLQPFSLEVSYYHGVDGGESWSEGGQTTDTRVSSMPGGATRVQLEIERDPALTRPLELNLVVREDSPNALYLFLTLIFISILPFFAWILKSSFERARWENSDYPKHTDE
jgi:hypothetical protein